MGMYAMPPTQQTSTGGLLSFAQGFAAVAFATGTALVLLGVTLPGTNASTPAALALASGALAFAWDFRKRPWAARLCGFAYAVLMLTFGLALLRYGDGPSWVLLSLVIAGSAGFFAFGAPIWQALRVDETRGNPLREQFSARKLHESNGVQFVVEPDALETDGADAVEITVRLQNAMDRSRRVTVEVTPLRVSLRWSVPELSFQQPSALHLPGGALETLHIPIQIAEPRRSRATLRVRLTVEGDDGERIRKMPGRVLFESAYNTATLTLKVEPSA